MEGISQEAIALAGHLKLNRLIVLFDDNGISIDGPLSLSDSADQVQRFEAAGWRATRVDGHDHGGDRRGARRGAEVRPADADRVPDDHRLSARRRRPAPPRRTASRSAPTNLPAPKAALGWSHAPFEVPADIRRAWREAGRAGAPSAQAWTKRLDARRPTSAPSSSAACAGERPQGSAKPSTQLKEKLAAEPQTIATRKASEIALDARHRRRAGTGRSAPPT